MEEERRNWDFILSVKYIMLSNTEYKKLHI